MGGGENGDKWDKGGRRMVLRLAKSDLDFNEWEGPGPKRSINNGGMRREQGRGIGRLSPFPLPHSLQLASH